MARRASLALILLSGFGILQRLELFSIDALHVDLAIVLLFGIAIVSLARDWVLGLAMLALSLICYLIGAALPVVADATLLIAGAILAAPIRGHRGRIEGY